MRIDYDQKIGKFIVVANPSGWTDQEDCRAIPNRKYDKSSGFWLAGPTRANAKYLSRWMNSMTQAAKDAVAQIEKGPMIRKTALPASFTFKTDPRPHQLEPLLRMNSLDEYALAMDPGTGKSKVLIDDSICSYLNKITTAGLVVCPNSIKDNWAEEIVKHGSGSHEILVYEPEWRPRIQKIISTPVEQGKIRWLIMGIESFSQGSADALAEQFLMSHRAVFILDESHTIKNHDKIRTKKIHKLGKLARRRRIATGTMITKGLYQAWSQYEFLNHHILDMEYYPFRNHFCIMGGFKGKQIVGNMNEEEFMDLVAPYTFRASKSECLKDLPPKVYQVRKVRPNPEQKRLYTELAKQGATVTGGGFSVEVFNALVRDLRLQQISGGFIATAEPDPIDPRLDYSDDEKIEEFIRRRAATPCEPIPGPNPKIEECLNVCEDVPGKIIFWSRFKPEIAALAAALRKEYGDRAVVEFHGDISGEDRTTARRRFQEDPECLYFVGQEATGGIGITLTAAQTMVYLGNDWSLVNRTQSEDRFHRIGQTAESVLIIDILIHDDKPWVDYRVMDALKNGKSYAESVMERMRIATGGM
jgi:hypothetical protein